MYADRLRTYLLTLPHVVETMQWGANLVFWTGDKAIGGKMFALINLDEPHLASGHRPLVISYAVGHVRYPELLEVEGLVPAPYMARIHWVAADRWDVFSTAEWQRELRSAYDLTLAKLPKKVLATLALPTKIQKDLIARRRKILTAKAAKRQA
jgi:predicted DNA-binding protein (MmcQ/YjbR family)